MTLEQTTRLILSSAELQDVAALQAAGEEREAALAKLRSLPPTEELRDAVAESLKAGEEARRTIRLIKQRIRNESRQAGTHRNRIPAHVTAFRNVSDRLQSLIATRYTISKIRLRRSAECVLDLYCLS